MTTSGGIIDDLRVYNRALSASEVTSLFALAPLQPTITSLTANPTSVTSGGSSNISWSSTNATACSVTKAGSAWRTGLTGTNVSSGALTANTAFIATCTGATGTTPASASVTVTVGTPGNIYYIRSGAVGNGSGSDWTNAYSALPATLQRGATYYVADGSYGSYVFDDPTNGTQLITIKKAITADHGTNTGWFSTYGDGQAVWGVLTFGDYYEFNGQVRNESQWDDGGSYGFRIIAEGYSNNAYCQNVMAGYALNNTKSDHLSIKYSNIGGTSSMSISEMCDGVEISSDADGINLSYNYVHHVKVAYKFGGTHNIIMEKNYFGPGFSKVTIRDFCGGDNLIIRNNVFIDACLGNPAVYDARSCTAEIWGLQRKNLCGSAGSTDGWEIYGNVFARKNYKDAELSDAAIQMGGVWAGEDDPASNWKIYNNVFAGYSSGITSIQQYGSSSSNNVAYNNIWYDIGYALGTGCTGGVQCSNNWCYSGSTAPCANMGTNPIFGTGNPFVNYTAGDFRLNGVTGATSPINHGYNLGSGFDSSDLYGKTRGSDGIWDIGAYEY